MSYVVSSRVGNALFIRMMWKRKRTKKGRNGIRIMKERQNKQHERDEPTLSNHSVYMKDPYQMILDV